MATKQTGTHRKVLIVDDEPGIRAGLAGSLKQMGCDVEEAKSGEEALYQLKTNTGFDFVLTDYKMPGLDGFDVLKQSKKDYPQIPVVMMTGHGNVHHAVDAMRMGADDYLCKPFRLDDLEKIMIKSKPEPSAEEAPQKTSESSRIITEDPKLQAILNKASRAAKSHAPILIEGPSGTGKELLARQIHEQSGRRSRPWVAVNCAALPAGLLESELFGFEKGAFTGATEKREGRFEQANHGTILLDEIGELDPLLQAKLLRVLQEGEVDRLGGRRSMKLDVRVIATTNRNLEELVKLGQFREDLYFRLYGVRFELPALCQRPADVELLAEHFLKQQAEQQQRELYYAGGVVEALKAYSWPGNIRELERAVERAAILSESGEIQIEDFDLPQGKDQKTANQGQQTAQVNRSIKEMEKEIILKSLEQHGGNRTHTAKSLGMSLRTLRHKLKAYREEGIEVDFGRQDSPGKFSRVNENDAGLGAHK